MRNQTGTDELHTLNGPEMFPVISLGWTEKKAVKNVFKTYEKD